MYDYAWFVIVHSQLRVQPVLVTILALVISHQAYPQTSQ